MERWANGMTDRENKKPTFTSDAPALMWIYKISKFGILHNLTWNSLKKIIPPQSIPYKECVEMSLIFDW